MCVLYTTDNSKYLATLTGMKHTVSNRRPRKSCKGSKNKAKDRTKEGTKNDDERNISHVLKQSCMSKQVQSQ